LKFLAVSNVDHITAVTAEVQNITACPQHPLIVEYYGCLGLPRLIVLAKELCAGSLTHFLTLDTYSNVPENQQRPLRWEILVQVADGLAAYHSRGILH
jgi:serine/threonine protein kinase